ncbi:hypothetical protein E3N88_17272 [Mikania micrantha]|uniref:VWFA domain-containing protein n=1 Tax=Mikania micrantha TaxID=192012 RepID=A0A5N6NRE3_9ASTR|nr:hypothetical protein E3N88_17272 [Mikania micrantha]
MVAGKDAIDVCSCLCNEGEVRLAGVRFAEKTPYYIIPSYDQAEHQVDGSNLSINLRWSQKVICKHGEFILNVPYSFPEYVTPASKKHIKKEKIQLYVNCGLTAEVVFMKEVVFVVDVSESMKGHTIEVTKNALIAALTKLHQDIYFGALKMFSGTRKSIPMVFFITDGVVENERQICEVM